MSDAELATLLRPHLKRLVEALRARTSELRPEDAPRFAEYFASSDGAFPADLHTHFNCTLRQFAEATRARMRLGGHPVAGSVTRVDQTA